MSRAFCYNALDTPYTYNWTNKYLITNKAMKKETGPIVGHWGLLQRPNMCIVQAGTLTIPPNPIEYKWMGV